MPAASGEWLPPPGTQRQGRAARRDECPGLFPGDRDAAKGMLPSGGPVPDTLSLHLSEHLPIPPRFSPRALSHSRVPQFHIAHGTRHLLLGQEKIWCQRVGQTWRERQLMT